MDDRSYLQRGTVIFGEAGERLRILLSASRGGTALTYYGEELLGGGQEPIPVYIKELYPLEGGYFRQENGAVRAADQAVSQIETAVLEQEFLREQRIGNQILKEGLPGIYPVTRIVRDRDTGNLYGVFYSCPPSMSLRAFVEEGCELSLAGKLRTTLELCRVVRGLHEKGGFCHRDISPGNILLLGAFSGGEEKVGQLRLPGLIRRCELNPQVGLIDFACAGKIGEWTDEDDMEDMALWVTEGFGAPERFDSERCEAAADVYSVTACLWYFLTGEAPFDGVNRDILRQCLEKHESAPLGGELLKANGKNPKKLSEAVFEHLFMALWRGLEEKERRYGSIALLEKKLMEVLALIEGEAVSEDELRKAAWERYHRIRKEGRLSYGIEAALLPDAREAGCQRKALIQILTGSSDSFFVIGEGGAGKTTSVLALLDACSDHFPQVIPVYLELNRLPAEEFEKTDAQGGCFFVERYLAGLFAGFAGDFSESDDPVAAAFFRRLRRKPSGSTPMYLAVLDGLNEMVFSCDQARRTFCKTVNDYLTEAYNLRLIITGRWDEKRIASKRLIRLKVEGLSDETLGRVLVQSGLSLLGKNAAGWKGSALWKVLHIPFFLSLYQSLSSREDAQNAGEIMERYFLERIESMGGAGDYGEKLLSGEKYGDRYYAEGLTVQAVRQLALQIVLPELGLFMTEQVRFFLRREEALSVLERAVRQAACAKRAELCRILGISGELSVIAERILQEGMERLFEMLTEQMGMLVASSVGTVSFLHQHYRDYFAALALVNRLKAVTVLPAGPGAELFYRFFDTRLWEEGVLQFAGELLGLPRETPVFDGISWERGINEKPVMERLLRLLKRSGRFYECLQSLRRAEDKEERLWWNGEEELFWGFSEANLLGMYRICCVGEGTGGRPDLSGLELSDMELSHAGIGDAVFSRLVPGIPLREREWRSLCADLTHTGPVPCTLLSASEESMIGCAVCHPTEPILLVSRESSDGISWHLEEWDQREQTKRSYAVCSPWAEPGYSDSGRYLWWGDPEEGELWAMERTTGRMGSVSLEGAVCPQEECTEPKTDCMDSAATEGGQLRCVRALSGERLGLVLWMEAKGYLAASLSLEEIVCGQCQTAWIPVGAGEITDGEDEELSFDMLDCMGETYVLAGSRRKIWLLAKEGCQSLFSLEEEEKEQGKLLFAADPAGRAVYVCLRGAKGTGRCLRLDPLTGEKTDEWYLADCEDSTGEYSDWKYRRTKERFLPEKAAGYRGYMTVAGGKVLIACESGFTEEEGFLTEEAKQGRMTLWTIDPKDGSQSYLWLDEEDESCPEGSVEISIGETITAIYLQDSDDGPLGADYTLRAVSSIDAEVYVECERRGKEDRFQGKAGRQPFQTASLSEAGGQQWLTVMDPGLHMALFLERTGERSFQMGGFCFPEGLKEPVMAVYTDWKERLIYLFDGMYIRAFSVDTGRETLERRLSFAASRSGEQTQYQRKMVRLFLDQSRIVRAAFTEGGESLILYLLRRGLAQEEEELWSFNLENGNLARTTEREEALQTLWDAPELYYAAERTYQALGQYGFTAGCVKKV